MLLDLGVAVLAGADVGQLTRGLIVNTLRLYTLTQSLRHFLRRHRGCLRGCLHLDVEQEADRLLLEPVEHADEHVVALALVLHQRIALRHGPQADALLEVVHLVEMLAPFAVQHIEQHVALELSHGIRAGDRGDLGFARGIGLFGVRNQQVEEFLAGQFAGLAERIGVDQIVMVDTHRVQRPQRTPQLLEVPVLDVALGGGAVDIGGDDIDQHVVGLLLQILTLEDPTALGVDDHALLVHHLVVLEHVLADLEVLLLDLGLRTLDRPGHHLGFNRNIIGQVEPGQQRLQGGPVEPLHEFVTQRQVEPRLTRVTLTTGAPAQLVVDTARLVPLGAQHVQPARGGHLLRLRRDLGLDLRQLLMPGGLVLLRGVDRVETAIAQSPVEQEVDVAAQHDVGTAAGHIGGHRHRGEPTRLGDDVGLLLVLLGVEHVVRHTALLQLPRQVLGTLDAGGADEHRLADLVTLGDIVSDRAELGLFGLVDQVGLVLADHVPVGGDLHHTELVDLVQLGGLGLGGAGHSGQLVVEPEVVLQCDGGQGLTLGFDLHLLLGLNGLVHALVVPAADEHASGELIDDDDLAVAHDVVLVGLEQFLGLERVVQITHQRRVRRLVEVLDAELVLDELHADLMHADGPFAEVDLVVEVLFHHRRQPGELGVPV